METTIKPDVQIEKMSQRERPESVKNSAERPRLQIDFTPQAYEQLNKMRERANVKSTTDVARNALRLYDWYLEKQAQGYHLLLAKGDEVKQVELLM